MYSQERPKSTSVNRVVYPDWWGEEDRDEATKLNQVAKRLKSADINKAKINKNHYPSNIILFSCIHLY